jgi:hypothetical protein
LIEIINLEKLSDDGYKMPCNTPSVSSLDNVTHAQLRYTPFTSSEAIQGAFVSGENSLVEFTVTGLNLLKPLKLFTSTDGTTYTQKKSYGGTNGKRLKDFIKYSARITQSGTSAPTLSEQYNDMGLVITPAYDDIGTYVLNFNLSILSGKYEILAQQLNNGKFQMIYNSDSSTTLETLNTSNAETNGILIGNPFTLIKYPDL